MSQPETEIYTYTQKQIFEGKTEIDYVQLNNNSYKSICENIIYKLNDNYENNCSYLFTNKNIQENVDANNSSRICTIQNNKGTVIYLLTPNANIFSIGDKFITKPVFTSGYYLGKDIEIIVEVIEDVDKTRKISLVFL